MLLNGPKQFYFDMTGTLHLQSLDLDRTTNQKKMVIALASKRRRNSMGINKIVTQLDYCDCMTSHSAAL